MTFSFVCGLLNAEQDKAVKCGDSEIPVEFRWSASGQGGVSQHKKGPVMTLPQ